MTAPAPLFEDGIARPPDLSATASALAAGLSDPSRAPTVRVGIDLVPVRDVVDSIAVHGDRYLERVFTPHELASCQSPERGSATYAAEALAARFAAKEAVVKVLRPRGARPEWHSIEVRRSGGGWCEIVLTGHAADLAGDAGIHQLAVSLTHETSVAAAVVVATCENGDGGGG